MPVLWKFGGTVTTYFELAREIVRQGHEVFALTTDARRKSDSFFPISEDTVLDEVPIRCCKMWGPAPPFWSPELKHQVGLRAPHFDIALIRSVWTYIGIAAGDKCLQASVPYITYPEGCFNPWTFRLGRMKKQLWWMLWEQKYFQRAAAIVALTASERDYIHQMGLTKRIEVIPNGINLEDLETQTSRAELENKWGQLKGKRWVLYLGRLHPIKGLDLLIESFTRISNKFPDHLLVIAGPDEGGYARKISRQINELNQAKKILLIGPVYGDLKIGLMKQAEAFLLTSYSEGFPMALLEALGCGIPAIITEGCNVPEVAEKAAGFVVPPSVERVSQALREFLRNDASRKEMGFNGYNLVSSRFTWDKVAQQTIALCKDILANA